MPDGGGAIAISLRVPADLLEKLDKIASAVDRSRSWVCIRAFRQYLAEEGSEILDVQEGITQLGEGASVPFEDVIAELRDIIANARQSPRSPRLTVAPEPWVGRLVRLYNSE
jgi:predicted transcriptional regulator